MVRMTNMVEARSTPSYPSMASPRYGACVSAFLHFFDWTAATKRLSSTKHLSGHKPEKAFRRPRSFRGGHGSTGKIPRMCQSGGNAVLDPDGSTRAPGVVARLMGLESLPQPPRHRESSFLHRDDHHGAPILLQDLLKREYNTSKKSTLRDRIPAIFPKRTTREEFRRRQTKKKKSVSLLTAFRCRPEVSPAYIPTTNRFLYSVARSPRSPFLSRLPPGSHTPLESPASCDPFFKPPNYRLLQEKIPELSLQASSTGTTVLLQGWPLGSQHIVPPDIFQEESFEPPVSTTSSSSGSLTRPSDSAASSKPLMAIGSYKVVQGKRRGSSWNGSEGSESTVEQPTRVGRKPSPSSREESVSSSVRNRNKPTRRSATTKTAKASDLHPLIMLPVENSRTSISQESIMSTGSLGSISSKTPTFPSKTPTLLPGKSKAVKTGRAAARVDHASTVVVTTTTTTTTTTTKKKVKKKKNKEEMAPKKSPPKMRNQKREVKLGSPTLVDSSSTPQRRHLSSEKASGVATRQRTRQQDRLTRGDHSNGTVSSDGIGGEQPTFKRRNKFLHKHHARARSVDDVFPELPFDVEIEKLMRSERVLDFLGECANGGDQISSSPLVDFASGACMLGRLSDSLVDDYELGSCWGVDFGKETTGIPLENSQISNSPLIDCDELRSLGDKANICEDQECENSFGVVDEEEDEGVLETVRCCERSCSGPSVSSESLLSDVEDDRNGESWSSSYHNLGDCHSPLKLFEIPEIDVEPNQEHQRSPPAHFVKKILDPLVDETGQPSPVSILNSPFHDEACTTPESSITECIHRQASCKDEIVDELDLPPTSVSNGDKIRQALLAISMFRSQEEELACDPFEGKSSSMDETKDERSFIRGVLSAAHFMCTPGSSPDWHDKDVVIDPSLFDKLESGDIVEFSGQAAGGGGLWRCDRKLLFDSVNQAFGLTRLRHCQGEQQGEWLQEELVWRSARPRGELLVVEVVKKIEEWRTLASYAIDSLIEKDMSVYSGDWKRFEPEVAEVGLDIENILWGDILEEVVGDMIVPSSKQN